MHSNTLPCCTGYCGVCCWLICGDGSEGWLYTDLGSALELDASNE